MSEPVTTNDRVEAKLAAARTGLILDKPFLGALVLRLPMQEADPDWCKTTATDARGFFYNRDYVDALSLGETQFVLAHEALHCALSHFARRQHRTKHKWDLACDFAVNPLLVDDGLTPPPNAVVLDEYKGMTAEEIYPLIEDNDETETLDTHAYDDDNQDSDSDSGIRESDLDNQTKNNQAPEPEQDGGGRSAEPEPHGGAERPQPLSPDEQEALQTQWQQRMAGAAQQAMMNGKLGGELARLIDHLLQPQLPWRMLLARYLSNLARDDFSWMRPSRREGDFILPSLRSQQTDLVVAIDTSGSIKDSEIEEFIQEIDALKGQVRARVTLLPCDAKLCDGAPFRYEPWETFSRPAEIKGGGGTRFTPVFDWIEGQDLRPELLVYFTDARGEFPKREPDFPVVWLVKGREKVPWGERIQLN